MQAEDLGLGVLRQLLDEFLVLLEFCVRWGVVDARRREPMVIVEDLFIVVVRKEGGQETAILVICDLASVVALASQILECIERSLVRVLVEEDAQLPDTDSEVIVSELIGDVPAKGAELSALLNDGMEEAEAED